MSIRKNPVAWLALFIALGGTSYAATQLPARSVGTRQLRNGAVIDAKVREHSLTSRVFAPGTLPAGLRTRWVTAGPFSPGPGASSGPVLFSGTASCNAGEHVTGGGYSIPVSPSDGTPDSALVSKPILITYEGTPQPEGWTVEFEANSGSSGTAGVYVYAVCASG